MLSQKFDTISGCVRQSCQDLIKALYSYTLNHVPYIQLQLWIAKSHVILKASMAAHLITRKVGVPVGAQDGYVHTLCCACIALYIDVYWLQNTDS